MDQLQTSDPAVWWGEGDYELRERAYEPIHERAVRADRSPPGRARARRRLRPRRDGRPRRPRGRRRDRRRPGARDDRASAPATGNGRLAGGRLPVAALRRRQLRRRRVELRSDLRARPRARGLGAVARLPRAAVVTAWMPQPGRELWPAGAPTCTGSRRWASERRADPPAARLHLETEERVWWLKGKAARRSGPGSSAPHRPLARACERLSESQIRATRAAWIDRYESFRVTAPCSSHRCTC